MASLCENDLNFIQQFLEEYNILVDGRPLGKTALDYAYENGYQDCVMLLYIYMLKEHWQ